MTPVPIGPARLVREPLTGTADPIAAARWLRGEPRAVALSGAWAGGGTLLSSHPVRRAGHDEDPFALLDAQPAVATDEDGVGGGWLGWLGFGLARRLEPVPPPPPRPVWLPDFDLAFHDHVVRCDHDGRWWFEALWTDARAAALTERLQTWRARLAQPVPEARAYDGGPLGVRAPGIAGHLDGVAQVVERIGAGEVFQVNLCLRVAGSLNGDPLDVWVAGAQALRPAYAALIAAEDHAVLSLSPELFLRRRGREVLTEPIKGTAPLDCDPADLASSDKDRAENVMIVDLMRNDLGRVCEYGSIAVPEVAQVREATGVWHLFSTVTGTLRAGAGDADLLRACFPPGSVTGAPKIRALRVISELEGTAREAYCGAVGICSPCSGLELNVAIRTLETAGAHVWLGVGGGVVADSTPQAEVEEALAKARPVLAAAGLDLRSDTFPATPAEPAPPAALAVAGDAARRPDPAHGLIETVLVTDSVAHLAAEHCARLRASAQALAMTLPPPDLARQVHALAATAAGRSRLRVLHTRAGTHLEVHPAPATSDAPAVLCPFVLPGGLGPHKWADRALIDLLSKDGTTPLLLDLDGTVLEAGYAAVLIDEAGRLTLADSGGRALESITAHALGVPRAPLTLERLRRADRILLASAIRGVHPATFKTDG